ncbi:MAG: alpha/beta fold hydrolase [Gemmatimonadaceae bacterium]
MRYLSSDIGELKEHYTVVVVGSGYGASIAASRLARVKGDRPIDVCILERGREILPGDYPRTLERARDEIHIDTPWWQFGRDNGMYDFRVNEDLNVFLGCGLGGTSLVNANVFKRADCRVFADERWPKAFQSDSARLEQGYQRAEEMMRPAAYPDGFPQLPKIEAMRTVGAALGLPFEKVRVNVNFTIDGPNHVGVNQKPCQKCGDCVTGCNYSAKNTLLMNYLPDAKTHGAEIFVECAVRTIERRGEKWVLHLLDRRTASRRRSTSRGEVSADIVILGAGALGSTEILHRSKDKGLSLSHQLGKRFTGNGDVLAFGIKTRPEIRGTGFGPYPPGSKDPVGPCIATLVDGRATTSLDDGMVIEEGVIPGALFYFFGEKLTLAAAMDAAKGDEDELKSLEVLSLEIDPEAQYGRDPKHVITYLSMAHDSGEGCLKLEHDRLRIDWPGAGDQEVFSRVDKALRVATRALGGHHIPNPVKRFGFTNTTVHPLGGCVMGDDAEGGVVNDRGQVFDGPSGSTVHEGLYVCDGAVIPRPLGVNPLLTISAVAERTVALLAEKQGWTIDYDIRPPAQPPGELRTVGIRFTETMRGRYSSSVRNSLSGTATASLLYPDASDAWTDSSPFECTLTIVWDEFSRLVDDLSSSASLTGSVTAPALSKDHLAVSEGTFNLFVLDPTKVNSREMRYCMMLGSTEGMKYRIEGRKLIHNDPGHDLWSDTTTLYATIQEGEAEDANIIGTAILRILPADFVHQLATVEVLNAPSESVRRDTIVHFGRLFAGALYDVYGGIFGRPVLFDPDAPDRFHRRLRLDHKEEHTLTANDGMKIRLTRYKGGDRGPVMLVPGFGTSTTAFRLDTIDTNLAEFLYANDYDVWLLDYRGSCNNPEGPTQFTLDDIALRDYPAAIEFVAAGTDGRGVQILGHCVGSVTLLMSLLSGVGGVRTAICSQFTVHVDQPGLQLFKAGIYLPNLVDTAGLHSMTPSVNSKTFHQIDALFDDVLRLYPTREQCNNPVCRRILFMYGEVFRHDQLNDATHTAIHEMFGIANMRTFEHLARVVRERQAVDWAGGCVYLPNVGNLRSTRMSIIQGELNHLFQPSGSERTHAWLLENGHQSATRRVIRGYGHMDCFIGRDSARDVFPIILEELNWQVPAAP